MLSRRQAIKRKIKRDLAVIERKLDQIIQNMARKLTKDQKASLQNFIISGEDVSRKDNPDVDQPVYLSNIIKHLTSKKVFKFSKPKEYADIEIPSVSR